jgi:hypothetical protein
MTDGKVVHKGFLPKIPESSAAFVEVSAELPLRLPKHLLEFDKVGDAFTLLMTSGFPSQTVMKIAEKIVPQEIK